MNSLEIMKQINNLVEGEIKKKIDAYIDDNFEAEELVKLKDSKEGEYDISDDWVEYLPFNCPITNSPQYTPETANILLAWVASQKGYNTIKVYGMFDLVCDTFYERLEVRIEALRKELNHNKGKSKNSVEDDINKCADNFINSLTSYERKAVIDSWNEETQRYNTFGDTYNKFLEDIAVIQAYWRIMHTECCETAYHNNMFYYALKSKLTHLRLQNETLNILKEKK